MKTAAIVYRSRTGTTRRFAEAIAAYLSAQGVETQVSSVGECDVSQLANVDFLLVGCWTSGLFVVLQHPDEPWLAFARDLPPVTRPRVGLFTTYSLVTGSMFPKMREALAGKAPAVGLELKSRNGRLSKSDERLLDQFIGEG